VIFGNDIRGTVGVSLLVGHQRRDQRKITFGVTTAMLPRSIGGTAAPPMTTSAHVLRAYTEQLWPKLTIRGSKYQRTATMITSDGNRNPAKLDRCGDTRTSWRRISPACLRRPSANATVPFNDYRPHRALGQAAPLRSLPPPTRHPSSVLDVAIGSMGCYTNTPRPHDVDDQFGTIGHCVFI
jgi:hypothetical protein